MAIKDKIDNLSQKVTKLSDKVNVFGPKTGSKMPGGEDNNPNKDNPLDYIFGCFAALITGEGSKTDSKSIRTLLSTPKEKTLFGHIDNIETLLNTLNTNIPNYSSAINDVNTTLNNIHKTIETISKKSPTTVIQPANVEPIAVKNDSESKLAVIEVNINSNGIDLVDVNIKLNKIVESIKNINEELGLKEGENLISNFQKLTIILDSFYNIIEDLTDNMPIEDTTNNIQKYLEKLKDIISSKDNKGTIESVMKELSNLPNNIEINDSVTNTFKVLNSLSQILKNAEDIDTNKASKNIKNIGQMLVGDSSILTIIENLKEITLDDKEKQIINAVNILNNFLDALQKTLNISPIKILKAKLSIFLLRELLMDSIIDIISDLNKIKTIINSDEKEKTLEVFNTFIDSITNLFDIKIEDRKKMRKNLLFIQNFLHNELQKFVESLNVLEESSNVGKEKIEMFSDLINSLINLGGVDEKIIDNLEYNLDNLTNVITNNLSKFLQSFSTEILFKDIKQSVIFKNIENIENIIKIFSNTLNLIPNMKLYIISYIKLSLMIYDANQIIKLIKILSNIDINFKDINQKIKNLTKIFTNFDKLAKQINTIDPNVNKNIDNLIKVLKKLDALSKLESLGKIADIGTKALGPAIDTIITIISKFNEVDEKSIEKANDTIDALMKIVIGSATILLIGGLVMAFIKVSDIIAFTVTLSIFLFAVTGVFKLISKSLKDLMEGVKDALLLVIGAGLILLLGGYLIKNIEIEDLIKFTVMLTLFLLGVSAVFRVFHKGFENAMEGAKDAVMLIGGAAAILLLGSLLVGIIDFGNAMKFTAMLGIFLLAVSVIFYFFHEGFENAMEGAKDAVTLIGGAALILILGSLIVDYLNWKNVLLFVVYLGGFLAVIAAIFYFFHEGFEKAERGAKQAIQLIVVSSLILVLGSIVMDYISVPNLIGFAVILAGFIWAIVGAFWAAGKQIEKAWKSIFAITLLTLVAGGLLLYAGKLISDNPWIAGGAALFGIILVGYVWLMGKVAVGLNMAAKKGIWQGLGVMTAIIAITGLAALVVKKLMEAVDTEDFYWKLLRAATAMFGMIVGVGGAAAGIGMLLSAGTGGLGIVALGMGAAVITGIIAIVDLAADAMKRISIAAAYLNAVKDYDFVKMIDVIKSFVGLTSELLPLGNLKTAGKILVVSKTIKSMNIALSGMAKAIKEWTTLRIPIYEGTKVIGYETITSDMFPKAAANIKQVVTTLSQAVVDAYNQGQEKKLFETDDSIWFNKLTSKTKFGKIAKAIGTLGSMLSSIASGIKDWAELKIPIYKENSTEIRTYQTIGKGDFVTAATNIKQVVITLSQAVVDAYNQGQKKKLFETDDSHWFSKLTGRTKFGKIAKAIGTLGSMLSSIASGIKDWAELKIPIYKENSTEIVGYKTISDAEFKTAGENIGKVITTLGKAVVEIVDSEEGQKLFFDNSDKVDSIMIAINKTTSAVKSISSVISYYASNQFPITEWKDGKLQTIGYIHLDENRYKQMEINIKRVILALSNAIKAVIDSKEYNNLFNMDLSNKDSIRKSKIMQLTTGINIISQAVNNILDTVKKLGELNINEILTKLGDYKTEGSLISNFMKVMSKIILLGSIIGEKGYLHYLEDNSQISNENLFKDIKNWEENITVLKDTFDKLNTAFDNISTNVNTIIEKFSSIDIQKLYSGLNNINEIMNAFAEKLINNTNNTNNTKDLKKLKELQDAQNALLVAKLLGINSALNEIKNIININDINIDKTKYNTFIDNVNSIYALINNSSMVEDDNIAKIKIIAFVLKDLLDVIEKSPENTIFETLRNGIESVYNAMMKIKTLENFQKHTEWLQKYIKAVNDLSIIRMAQLVSFVEAVERLSQRLGDLDKLTDAIGEKLASVLCELVNQLRKADASIQNAHELQAKRKQLIDESLNNIRGLMSQHMIVEITQPSQEEKDLTQPDTANESTPSLGSPLTNNDNPEGAGGNTTSLVSKQPNNTDFFKEKGDVRVNKLTVNEFKRLCAATFESTVLKKS